MKDLGIVLDSRLTYATHIDKTYKKALRMLGYLFRTCNNFTNLGAIRAVYFAYVRSHLDYCCQIWNPRLTGDCVLLEKIQRRFARFVYNRGLVPVEGLSEFHYRPVLESLGMRSLECRRDYFDAMLLLRILYFDLGGLSLGGYRRHNAGERELRSHRTFTTLIDCPSALNRCIQLLNNISFDWESVAVFSYSGSLGRVLEGIPLFR